MMDFLDIYDSLPSFLIPSDTAGSLNTLASTLTADESDEYVCVSRDSTCSSHSTCTCDGHTPCSCDAYVPVPAPPQGTYFQVIARGLTSITIEFGSLENATYYEVAYRTTDTTTAIEERTTSTRYTITGLSPGTDYVVNYRGYNGDVPGPYMATGVTASTIAVEPWNWSGVNGSHARNASETQRFYQVLHGQQLPEDGFSANVWNDLVDKVNEVISAGGHSWLSHGGITSHSQCYASGGDKVSASKYNALRYQIDESITALAPTGIADQAKDSPIFGYYITYLTDKMNAAINQGLL